MPSAIEPTNIEALLAIHTPEKDESGYCINLPAVSKPVFHKVKLTVEMLRYYLHYFPTTGEWFWRNPRLAAQKMGTPANARTQAGYVCIRLRGELYLAHRLAFLYVTGKQPSHTVDHINLTRDDNRWENLRDIPHAKNCANSPASTKENYGAYYHPDCNRWAAQLGRRGRTVYLGLFPTKEEAALRVQQYLSREKK